MKHTDERTNDSFIMLPTVDFCFKELMKNPKVRKGFIAAVLGKEPDAIRNTILLPTELRKETQNEDGVIRWMRFLGGKKREEFEHMAERDEYIQEAYNELKKLSLDEQKRVEYELREKAVRDYNTQMKSAEKRGIALGEKRGIELGEKRGIEKGRHLAVLQIVGRKADRGASPEAIAEALEMDLQEVIRLVEEWKREKSKLKDND